MNPQQARKNEFIDQQLGREQTSNMKGDKNPSHIVAGKPEPSLYAELTMRDKDEKMKVKIFTVSLGIRGQEASEMLLPGIMPETLEQLIKVFD